MFEERVQGQLVAGRYRLDRCIGEGGMALVWAATHQLTGKAVALKFLKPPHAFDPRDRHRFLREARAACAVHHPNVVEIDDVLELEDGSPVMVMDLLVGETLGHKLERGGPLQVEPTARVLLPVLSAVGTAHALGIVHRDLKPDNIYLAEVAPGRIDVKVLDFGIAKVTAIEGSTGETGNLTGSGMLLGTPFYMSPEQLFGDRDIDQRCDVWALGIILYECLSGRRPTQSDNLGQVIKVITTESIPRLDTVVKDLPGDVADLVARMLSRRRDDRPYSLHEVRDVLARHCELSVPPFGEPAKVRTSLPTAEQSAPTPAAAPAAVAAGETARRSDAASLKAVSPVAATLPDTTRAPSRPSPTRYWATALALGAVGVLVAGYGVMNARQAPATGPATSGEPSTASVVGSAPLPPPPLASTRDDPAPATSVSGPPGPSASASGRPTPSSTPARPKPSSSTPSHPAPPPSASGAPSPTASAPGGIIERPNF